MPKPKQYVNMYIYSIVHMAESYGNVSPLWLSWHLQRAVPSAHQLCSLVGRTSQSPVVAFARRRPCAGARWGSLRRPQTCCATTHGHNTSLSPFQTASLDTVCDDIGVRILLDVNSISTFGMWRYWRMLRTVGFTIWQIYNEVLQK